MAEEEKREKTPRKFPNRVGSRSKSTAAVAIDGPSPSTHRRTSAVSPVRDKSRTVRISGLSKYTGTVDLLNKVFWTMFNESVKVYMLQERSTFFRTRRIQN